MQKIYYKLSNICVMTGCLLCPVLAFSDDYFFDPALFQGSAFGQDLARFNNQSDNLLAGEYLLDIYVNDVLISSQEKVYFNVIDNEKSIPSLSSEVIKKTQIRMEDKDAKGDCFPINELGKNIYWDVDRSRLRLNLFVAQKDLYQVTRGYIPVSEWDEGNTTLFIRHNTNYSRTQSNSSDYDYLWSNIYSGINLGLWQVRHQGNFRYFNSDNSENQSDYNSVRTWLQRPIPELESTLVLGDNFTNSNLLGGLTFKGLKLSTDQRMWAQSKRGYAPEVRGNALTSARVLIKQQGKVIYETSVPPGEFIINDLYNTRMQGDLDVEVIEANGQISTFTVPYSSTPDSVRMGNWNYEFSVGKVSQFDDVDNEFIEGILQYGFNNYVTTNIGIRLGKNYQAGLFGGVFSSSAGAFGLNTTWSRSQLEHEEIKTGWRVEGSYSNSFSTGTNIVLSAYRYSTEGFRDLQDVLGVLRQHKHGTYYDSDTLKQRNRLSMTISQPLGEWGSFYMSGSTADYYSDKSRVNQLQLGYNNSWKSISYNLSLTRQQLISDSQYNTNNAGKSTENTILFSMSIPLDFGESRSSLSFDANKTSNAKSGNVRMTGSAGKQGDFTYSIYSGIEHINDEGGSSTWGANIQQNTAIGSFRGAILNGKNYHQFDLGTSGTFVLHSDGVTMGPYVSDTFALVYAPGAKGAIIKNGQGAKVNRWGYAIMPSLTPYRYNNIVLDTSDMDGDVELKGGGEQIVPYYGATAKVSFDTIAGRAVLINLMTEQGVSIPMGSEVINQHNDSIGMVGQGAQVYARLADVSGVLKVMWGQDITQSCKIRYQLPEQQSGFVTTLNLPCIQE